MLRRATLANVQRIRTLMQAVPGFWQRWWSDDTLADAIRSANGLSFVYQSNSQLIGFICAHDLGFRAYLSELVVHPDNQRQGIGSRLLDAVETALRERGQRILIADVWHDAEPFYRAQGWEPPDVVLLRRRLTPAD